MIALILKLLSGTVFSTVLDVVKSFNERKISEEEARAKVAETLAPELSRIAQQQANVLVEEMRGNWLQRNWRPIVALGFAFIPFFYGIVVPVLVAWFGFTAPRVGDQLLSWIMASVNLCLGGYVAGKSVEAVAESIGRYFGKK